MFVAPWCVNAGQGRGVGDQRAGAVGVDGGDLAEPHLAVFGGVTRPVATGPVAFDQEFGAPVAGHQPAPARWRMRHAQVVRPLGGVLEMGHRRDVVAAGRAHGVPVRQRWDGPHGAGLGKDDGVLVAEQPVEVRIMPIIT